ncbi:MAG TPA: prenyltransferase/squalene oxidase repeat-containing protein [Candidatus Acidoferrum sp.]|nr:prenyltransferase/squalene oxidase repeat-containing protein [Candidatus Acidoferrum sp.]
MAVEKKYLSDVEAILSHIHELGGELWTTPDRRILKGSPFSAVGSALLLLELGMDAGDSPLKETAQLIFSTWQEDGRFKVYPTGSIYPCQTAHAASALCQMGYASDARLQKTFRHLLETQYADGGWRCNKFSYGRGPETEYSNPFPTLVALNAFRFSDYLNKEPALDRAVDFLLQHWTTRLPLGPCHYGIGTLFMQVEYPFGNYNLFIYVYVLSFYERAKKDPRFLDALKTLESKTVDEQVVPLRTNKKLAGLTFCRQGEPSELATMRYREILKNLE